MDEVDEILSDFLVDQITSNGMHILKVGRVVEKLRMNLKRKGFVVVKKPPKIGDKYIYNHYENRWQKEKRDDTK